MTPDIVTALWALAGFLGAIAIVFLIIYTKNRK